MVRHNSGERLRDCPKPCQTAQSSMEPRESRSPSYLSDKVWAMHEPLMPRPSQFP